MCCIAVCAALTTICKLVNVDAMGALVPQITSLITHSKEIVRKKVVMALQKLYQLDPRFEGPLAGVDIERLFRQALCDKVRDQGYSSGLSVVSLCTVTQAH